MGGFVALAGLAVGLFVITNLDTPTDPQCEAESELSFRRLLAAQQTTQP